MRTVIAGSRTVTNMLYLHEALAKCGWLPTLVACGGAKGADALGKEWADMQGIPVEYFLADRAKYSRAAGMIRNVQMADNAEALIALWDGESKGTANMINVARARKLKVYVQLI